MTCKYDATPCTAHCGAKISRFMMADHLKFTCPRRRVVCEHCHGDFSGEQYEVRLQGSLAHHMDLILVFFFKKYVNLFHRLKIYRDGLSVSVEHFKSFSGVMGDFFYPPL